MKKSCIFWMLILLIGFAFPQESQSEFYGFASLKLPSAVDKEYQLRWANIGIIRTEKLFCLDFRYNLASSSIQRANVKFKKDLLKGKIYLTVGKYLNPVRYLDYAPVNLPLTRWPLTQNYYSFPGVTGVMGQYQQKNLSVYLSHYNDILNVTSSSAVLMWKKIGVFWYEYIGYGIAITEPISISFLNLRGGITVFQKYGKSGFIQNEFKVPFLLNLSWFDQIDYFEKKIYYLGGLTYTYGTNCFLKLYYEEAPDSEKQIKAEMTFSF